MALDDELLADDRQARIDALDVTRSFIVQAPAGSGKTELLIQRYLRLLATVENPEEILAITFTRKAAAEMRMRVLQALQRSQRGEQPEEDHQQRTADAAATVLERDSDRGWQLIMNPRRMRIQTLDALNASIARMLPLTATSGGAASTVADEGEMTAIYAQASMATLDWLGEKGENASATKEVLGHVDNNTGIYIDYLSRMLKKRDQWLRIVGSGRISEEQSEALRREFEQNLEQVVCDKLTALERSVPLDAASEFLALAVYAVENLRADGHGEAAICAFGDAPQLPDASAESLPAWCALAELLLTQKGDVRKLVNKNQGFPPGDDGQKKAMHELLASLAAETTFAARLHEARSLPPVRYSDEQWSVLLALFRLLPVAVAELRRLCLARGVTDYIEIALGAGEALGSAENPGDVALLLDYQVRHILVDEMQDTSRAQYRMLEALTGGWTDGDGRTLFCVGDPMQSIYRFRNAEVAQFLLARQSGVGAVHLQPLVLRRNFRSGERLVDWFNEVFPRVLPAKDDPGSGAVSYSAAVAVDRLRGRGDCHVHPVFGSSVDAEAEVACNLIADTLHQNEDDDIAVLVRGRTQLPSLLEKLRDAGIGYQAIDIDRLTDLPEVIDILALTRAFLHRGDRVAWLGLLRSPWVGLDWTDLHALVRDARYATVWELLGDEERVERLSPFGRAAVRRVLPLLDKGMATDRSTTLHLRVERLWFELGGPALLKDSNAVNNVYHFLDTLAKLERGGTIADVAELTAHLDVDRVSTNVAARVQIMTMHKAKGLQFDHVLLYGLGRHPGGSRKSVLSWFDLPDQHGSERKLISPIGRRDDIEHDPVHRYIELTEAAKEKHEKGRLLYVACTRARKSLHLLGHVVVKPDGSDYRSAHASSLLALLWSSVEPDYRAAFATDSVTATQPENDLWYRPVLRRLKSDWSVPEVESLPGKQGGDQTDEEARKVEYYWVGVDARLAGTVVHRWLQMAAERRVEISSSTLPVLRETSRRWLLELGAGEHVLESVCDRIDVALSGVLNDEKGRWLITGEGEAELALTGNVHGRAESIIIDRVRVDDDGTHWIVDYKTSSHEGGDLEGFLRAECDRYREQLNKYASVYRAYAGVDVRTALYFPLLKRFVEVDV